MLWVTIISKNLLTWKNANGQTVERIDYAITKFELTNKGTQMHKNTNFTCFLMIF